MQVLVRLRSPTLCRSLNAGYPAPVLRTDDPLPMTDTPPAIEDEQIVRAMAKGDREALGELYDRFAPSMLSVGQRILGSAREAEDLVHDVFLEAWQRAHHYDRSRGSVRTWLMLRVRSRALDRLRASRRAPLIDPDAAKHSQPPPDQADAASARDGRMLLGVLSELPQDQRTVLELGYFAGYSCSEIAARLEIPIGTVKSRMSRAIAELRIRLQVDLGEQP